MQKRTTCRVKMLFDALPVAEAAPDTVFRTVVESDSDDDLDEVELDDNPYLKHVIQTCHHEHYELCPGVGTLKMTSSLCDGSTESRASTLERLVISIYHSKDSLLQYQAK
jgi:hypothetical protein